MQTEIANRRGRLRGAVARSTLMRNLYTKCARLPVIGSLLHGAAGRLFPGKGRTWVQIPQGLGEGLWICADPRFEFHLLGRAYEPQMQDLLRAHLKPGGCFYDL